MILLALIAADFSRCAFFGVLSLTQAPSLAREWSYAALQPVTAAASAGSILVGCFVALFASGRFFHAIPGVLHYLALGAFFGVLFMTRRWDRPSRRLFRRLRQATLLAAFSCMLLLLHAWLFSLRSVVGTLEDLALTLFFAVFYSRHRALEVHQ